MAKVVKSLGRNHRDYLETVLDKVEPKVSTKEVHTAAII
jgi:hypothetical protein